MFEASLGYTVKPYIEKRKSVICELFAHSKAFLTSLPFLSLGTGKMGSMEASLVTSLVSMGYDVRDIPRRGYHSTADLDPGSRWKLGCPPVCVTVLDVAVPCPVRSRMSVSFPSQPSWESQGRTFGDLKRKSVLY